jgi:hypothetical protein
MRDSGENPEHIECFGFIDMYLTGSLGAKT